MDQNEKSYFHIATTRRVWFNGRVILRVALWALVAVAAQAQTNVLQLTWAQPPGYTSKLYCATNLDGNWTPLVLASNQPPVSVSATQSVAFFYVVVAPTNTAPQQILTGDFAAQPPTPTTPTAIGVDTNNGTLWEWYNNAWH